MINEAPAAGSVAGEIHADLIDYKASKIHIWKAGSNSASLLGHPCTLLTGRHLFLKRTLPVDRLPKHTVEKQMLFDDGNVHEDAVVADLRAAGHPVEETQRTFEMPEYQIRGKIDGFIHAGAKRWPLEIKAMSPSLYGDARKAAHSGVLTVDDIRQTENPWLLKYAAQLNIYLLMANMELGVFAFKDKQGGELALYEMPIDMVLGEQCLNVAGIVNTAMSTGEAPPWCGQPSQCARCELCAACKPPVVEFGDQQEIMADPELEEALRRRDELAAAVKEHAAIDAKLKHQLAGRVGLCGDFEITGKWVERAGYEVQPSKYWQKKIKRWRTGQ